MNPWKKSISSKFNFIVYFEKICAFVTLAFSAKALSMFSSQLGTYSEGRHDKLSMKTP